MSISMSRLPDDEHLERFVEYPRRAHPLMKQVLVEAMESGAIVHVDHQLPSMCVFERTAVSRSPFTPFTRHRRADCERNTGEQDA